MLDLESVRLFVLTVDLGGLTRAAEAVGTAQPVVSQRIKALEGQLGTQLLERSPRFVRPTAAGAAFLARARALLAAHDAAIGFQEGPALHLRLGISDHVMGAAAGPLLRRLRAALPPDLRLELKVSLSQSLRTAFEQGELDSIIIRREAGGGDGEVLGSEPLIWCGDPTALPGTSPLPIASLGEPCGVRAMALRALERDNIPWYESFIAGSSSALLAGISAGFGIAPMGQFGAASHDVGPLLGLPRLPTSNIVLLGRAAGQARATAINAIAASVRAALAAPTLTVAR